MVAVLVFFFVSAIAFAAEDGGSAQKGAQSSESEVPKVDAKNWINETASVIDKNRSPMILIEGVATNDNTARLPGGYQDAAHALERDVLKDRYDLIVTLRNGRFELYDPNSDRSVLAKADPAGGSEFRRGLGRFGEGLAGFFGRGRVENSSRRTLQKLIDDLNDGSKKKSLSMERKLAELQRAIEPMAIQDQASVALVLRNVDELIPRESANGSADKTNQTNAQFLKDLSLRYDYAGGAGSGKPFTTILLAESEAGFHADFLKSADYSKVSAGLPNESERRALVESVLELYPTEQRSEIRKQIFSTMDEDNFVRRTHGMDRSAFLELLQGSVYEGARKFDVEPVTLKLVKKSQQDSISKISNKMITPLDMVTLSRDLVAGDEAKKAFAWLDEQAQFLRDGRYELMPYFFGVGGTSGTGKTFIFEVVSGEDNFPLSFYKVDFAQANSKWVGELGKNLGILKQVMLEAPPGTVFLFDEVISKLAGGKGEGAGAAAVEEFRGFIREMTEDLKGTGKMVGFMDSKLGFEIAGINPKFEADEFTRMSDRLVFQPAFEPENKTALLDVIMRRYKVSADDRAAIMAHLESDPILIDKIPPVPREIDGVVQKLVRQRVRAPQEAVIESLDRVLGDAIPSRPPNWYAKWVASFFMYNSKADMPAYVRKWFETGNEEMLKTWVKQWEYGSPVKKEQLAVLLAPTFEGHEKIMASGTEMFPDSAEFAEALPTEADKLEQALLEPESGETPETRELAGVEAPEHTEDPESLSSRPATPKKRRVAGGSVGGGSGDRCGNVARKGAGKKPETGASE